MSKTLRLQFPSDPKFLSVLRAVIGSVAEIAEISEKETGMLKLAIVEAVTNIIRHSLKNEFDHTIEFDLVLAETELQFVLRDDGEAADGVFDIQPPAPSPNQPGGAGLCLIHECMDKILYERLPNNLNQLRLVKRLRQCSDDPRPF